MTVGFYSAILLTDADAVQVSHKRALRIAADVKATLLRNLPGVDEAAADACAANIAAAWGELGLVDDGPEGASER